VGGDGTAGTFGGFAGLGGRITPGWIGRGSTGKGWATGGA
jgi:hypothetical protein